MKKKKEGVRQRAPTLYCNFEKWLSKNQRAQAASPK
jgi:hypothetical protein